MKVALVHDWLNGMRGGEKILEVLCEMYPSADVFTLLYEPEKVSPTIRGMRVHTSFIQKLPGARRGYRSYLPLFPLAVESFDLRGHDLVISTSHAVAKGCRAPVPAWHICYCFTPMRYLWFFREEYFGRNPLTRTALWPFFAYLRRWDIASARRVNDFFAISKNVAQRISRVYHREAGVVYPPVDADFFRPARADGGYFLIVSALVPYKRLDLAIGAFQRLGLPLKIIGSGPLAEKLKRSAPPNVEFLGWQDDENLRDYYQRSRALVFPGVEDFGIVPLEAMACGRPVIGFGEGGLLESVQPYLEEKEGSTGIFFYEPSVESLMGAVKLFLEKEAVFDPEAIRKRALGFDRPAFREKLSGAIENSLARR